MISDINLKKKFLKYSLMAAIVCGLSMGFTACSDDDNNNSNSGDTEVMNADQTDEAAMAWSWVSVLTDVTDQATDWQSKSYVPTIGVASTNKPTARVIYVSNLADAKANFASIAGCSPEELSGTKTISAGEFGTMQWNISAKGAQNIATVDVDSKLIPQLQQIIYCTEDQAPDNASNITGNCYYRLGDVIQDKDGYYWICVQPSFLGKKNNESYWINVFNNNPKTNVDKDGTVGPGLPEKNIYSKYNKKYNGNTIMLPTCLKENRQQNYNLANLMWALWNYDFFKPNGEMGLAGLPAKDHGQNYLREVRDAWTENKIWEKLFNCTYTELMRVTQIRFFYKGYQWKIGSTAGVWIYKSNGYQVNYTGSQSDDKTYFEMKKAGYGFDVRRYVGDPNQDKNCASTRADKYMAPHMQVGLEPLWDVNQDESATTGYWVVRVSTGKQLDSRYDPYKPLTNVKDIYRFNEVKRQNVGPEAAVVEDGWDVNDPDDGDDDEED